MTGQNPNPQNQMTEVSDLTALLRDLPRVSAPVDFQAQLKARIVAASAEASEFAGIRSLLQALPQVSAPPDFDFKLRARLAQQTEKPKGWWQALWGHGFSLAQAGAALALVAVIVTGVTFKMLPSEKSLPMVAVQTPHTSSTSSVSNPSEDVAINHPVDVPLRSTGEPPNASTTKPRMSRAFVPAANRMPVAVKTTEAVPVAVAAAVAAPQRMNEAGTVIIKHANNGSARTVNLVSYGQQTAMARSTAGKAPVDELAAQIY